MMARMTSTVTPTAESTPSRFDRHERVTLAVASLATLATFLDTTILYVAFPDISATFASRPGSDTDEPPV